MIIIILSVLTEKHATFLLYSVQITEKTEYMFKKLEKEKYLNFLRIFAKITYTFLNL